MAKGARRYDIYLPLAFNDGRPIPRRHLHAVEQSLLQQFKGVTSHRPESPLRGAWVDQKQLYLDPIIVLTSLDFRPRGSPGFIANLKRRLLEEFEQLDILITETPLRVH